ncbi:HNH endonuclease [Streptomyces tanashiensis]|uniref:HNH endonuclease n=1 Tax=Streptomyces tanashiensis TaxID=67367 RepID=UPI00226437B9
MDHVRPLSMGGTDTAGNVQVLCRGCHALKTRTEFGAAGSCRTSCRCRATTALPAYRCAHHVPAAPPTVVVRAISHGGMRWTVKCSPPTRSSRAGCVSGFGVIAPVQHTGIGRISYPMG